MLIERESWAQYVQRITRGRQQKDIARAAGIHPSGVSRWLAASESRPRAETVVQFARGMGQAPVEALMAAGYLDPNEVDGAFEVMFSPSALTDDDLIEVLRERLAQRPKGGEISSRLTPPSD